MEKRSSSGFSGDGLRVFPNKLHSQMGIAPAKTGGEIFNFLASGNKTQHLTENINLNTGKGREGMGKLPWGRDATSSSEHTSESRSGGGRHI